jgi:hypothetical protein
MIRIFFFLLGVFSVVSACYLIDVFHSGWGWVVLACAVWFIGAGIRGDEELSNSDDWGDF